MALLQDLFSSKRKVFAESVSRDSSRSFSIAQDQVRLLLFKESDWRGRKILYDSSTIEKVTVDKNVKNFTKLPSSDDGPCIVEVCDGVGYKYTGPAADTKPLGEMMFGAVAMNYSGVSFKIHILHNPHRLMCTKVFTVPARATGERGSERALSTDSLDTSVSQSRADDDLPLSFSFERGDSGYYGQSPPSSVCSAQEYAAMADAWGCQSITDDMYNFQTPPSGRKLSSCSGGSWQRRMERHLSTRFDNLLSVPSAGSRSDSQSQMGSSSGSSATCSSTGSSARRRTKLGLALLIALSDDSQMEMLRRCAEHSPQLESMFCRLRVSVLAAGRRRLVHGLTAARAWPVQWLSDLLNGPRVPPMWLNLVQAPVCTGQRLAESLLSDLCYVLHHADTKHTKFFISTLLTYVLTFHLGWVSTVSPYEISQDDPSIQRYPYNALWAQLNDLHGSIGCPPRAARTIIAGKRDKHFINKLLSVLTYFVRCGEVNRNIYRSEDFEYAPFEEFSVTSVPVKDSLDTSCGVVGGLKRTSTRGDLTVTNVESGTVVNSFGDSSRTVLPDVLSMDDIVSNVKAVTPRLKRSSTVLRSLAAAESETPEVKERGEDVVFVLGDDEKLIGLKNKSASGKSVKKSSKSPKDDQNCDEKCGEICDKERSAESPTRCCGQLSQHSKPLKHSGFKFEFDKYPQIVTNYMKSKNLEILDRHYIGKPGNLKLDNFQFDPTVVPPIQEETFEKCYQCQQICSTLQTPTNASELWSDMSNDEQVQENSSLQKAKETVCEEGASEKAFVRKRKKNTVVINLPDPIAMGIADPMVRLKLDENAERVTTAKHLRVIDVKMPSKFNARKESRDSRVGYQYSLLGGVTDHYIPDMIVQGTLAPPSEWESELRRDLDLATHINKQRNTPLQTAAIIADSDLWSVRVVVNGGGGGAGGGMSELVGAMLDALPHMRRARVPAHQCLSFVESKLRELCVLSKSLAELLMTSELCDMATLTKALCIDANDVPLLLAVATTHTPILARRYGVSYR